MTDYSAVPLRSLVSASALRPTATMTSTAPPRMVRALAGVQGVAALRWVLTTRQSLPVSTTASTYLRPTVTPTRTAWVSIARGSGGSVVARPTMGQLWPRARSVSS